MEVNAPLVVLRGSPSIQRESRWCSSAQRLSGHMGISLKLETQQRARGEVKAHVLRLPLQKQTEPEPRSCGQEKLCGGNYRGTGQGGNEKGATLLAQIIAPDFCPSLDPAAA